MNWRIDDGCLRLTHPAYHDAGSPLEYSVEPAEPSGHWCGTFEGTALYAGPSLRDCLEACERDYIEARALKFQDDEAAT